MSCLVDRPFRDDEKTPGCITTDALGLHRSICSEKASELATFAQSAGRRICGQSAIVCAAENTREVFHGVIAAGRGVGVDCDHFNAKNIGGTTGWVVDLCGEAFCHKAGEKWTCETRVRR